MISLQQQQPGRQQRPSKKGACAHGSPRAIVVPILLLLVVVLAVCFESTDAWTIVTTTKTRENTRKNTRSTLYAHGQSTPPNHNPCTPRRKQQQQQQRRDGNDAGTSTRRSFLVASSSTSLSSLVVSAMMGIGTTSTIAPTSPAHAKEKGPPPMSVKEAVDAVAYELRDPMGSVGRLQNALDDLDYAALLEQTKTMDQSLRKRVVGQAKYYWSDQNRATQLSNAVTFDLIGINRNARSGQESRDGVRQYLDELRQDLSTILRYTEEAAASAAETTVDSS